MTEGNGNAVDYFVDRHLREGRGDRLAFADPWRRLTYGELAAESARFASGLRAAGIERERRIALVMLDTVDFPIAFWGALRAGIVPVPINTLLPPEITGYILRGQPRRSAVRLGAAVRAAAGGGGAGRDRPRRGQRAGRDQAAISPRFSPVAGRRRRPNARRTRSRSGCIRRARPARRRACRHVHSSLRATAETYGTQVLGIAPDDLMFSAAKLFFAYGLGNSMTFPMAVGAASVLLPDRPTPDAVLATMRRYRPTIFAGVPTLYAALLAHPEIAGKGAGSDRLRRCYLGRRAVARAYRHALARAGRVRHPRRARLDRDAAHLPVEPARRHPLRHHGQAGAGLRGQDRRRERPSGRRRRAGRADRIRPQRRRGVLEPAREIAAHVPRRVDPYRRHLYARRRRVLPLQRAQRRHAEGRRHLGVAVRGRGGADRPQGGAGGRGRRNSRTRTG